MQNTFRSKEEILFAKYLNKKGIPWLYEPWSIVVLEKFKTTHNKYRSASYTPDFIISYKGKKIVVEIKGRMFGMGYQNFKLKCAAKAIWEKFGWELFVVAYVRSKKDFYLFHDKNRCKKMNIKNFLDHL